MKSQTNDGHLPRGYNAPIYKECWLEPQSGNPAEHPKSRVVTVEGHPSKSFPLIDNLSRSQA